MINMSAIIDCPDFQSTVDVLQYSGGGYGDDGRPVEDVPTRLSDVVAVCTKATAKEIKQLDLGETRDEIRRFLTKIEINLSTDESQSDRFVWHGKRYKVIKVDDNGDYGFYRSFAVYEGRDE